MSCDLNLAGDLFCSFRVRPALTPSPHAHKGRGGGSGARRSEAGEPGTRSQVRVTSRIWTWRGIRSVVFGMTGASAVRPCRTALSCASAAPTLELGLRRGIAASFRACRRDVPEQRRAYVLPKMLAPARVWCDELMQVIGFRQGGMPVAGARTNIRGPGTRAAKTRRVNGWCREERGTRRNDRFQRWEAGVVARDIGLSISADLGLLYAQGWDLAAAE